MEAVKIQQRCIILAGSPGAHDEPGDPGSQFAPGISWWDDEED